VSIAIQVSAEPCETFGSISPDKDSSLVYTHFPNGFDLFEISCPLALWLLFV
jgi:hypothetical protein